MTTARVLPSTYVEHTYGEGCDYEEGELALWEGDTDVSLTSVGGYVLTVSPGTYDDNIAAAGASGITSTKFRCIRGSKIGGAESVVFDYTGSLTVYSGVFSVGENRFRVYDATIRYHGSSAADVKDVFIKDASLGNPARLAGCVLGPSENGNSSHTASGAQCYTGYGEIIDTIVAGHNGYGVIANNGIGCSVLNCTIYDTGLYGLLGVGTGSRVVENTIIQEFGSGAVSGTWTIATCVYDDSAVFADAANGDFSLDGSDTSALGQGSNLSSSYTDDFSGGTWIAPWDIGAIQYVPPPVLASVGESLSLGESLVPGCSCASSLSEGVALEIFPAAHWLCVCASADGISASENYSRHATFAATSSESIVFGGAVEASVSMAASILDGGGILDAQAAAAHAVSASTDEVFLSDQAAIFFTASASDGIALADKISATLSSSACALENLLLHGGLAPCVRVTASVSATAGMGETTAAFAHMSGQVSDSIILMDMVMIPVRGALLIAFGSARPAVSVSQKAPGVRVSARAPKIIYTA